MKRDGLVRTKVTTKGRRRGRPVAWPETSTAEQLADLGRPRQLARQLRRGKRKGPEMILDIIYAEISKRCGGPTIAERKKAKFADRAHWLLKHAETLGLKEKPRVSNLPAIERWLRDPTASSLAAAIRIGSRGKKPKRP